jgi:hypothetical protein
VVGPLSSMAVSEGFGARASSIGSPPRLQGTLSGPGPALSVGRGRGDALATAAGAAPKASRRHVAALAASQLKASDRLSSQNKAAAGSQGTSKMFR